MRFKKLDTFDVLRTAKLFCRARSQSLLDRVGCCTCLKFTRSRIASPDFLLRLVDECQMVFLSGVEPLVYRFGAYRFVQLAYRKIIGGGGGNRIPVQEIY